MLVKYFPYLAVFLKSFYEAVLHRTSGFIATVCSSEEKINHILKTGGDKLFKNLLTNKILSKQILSWNLKMELFLKRGLVRGFLS